MSEHIISINSAGQLIKPKCSHPLIPGLDADYCRVCDTWWIDQQMTDRLLKKKRDKA